MFIVDTLPKILKMQAEKYGSKKVAMRKKDLGIWKEYTWKDSYDHVKWISLGLSTLGFRHGDKIAIVGDTDPQWYWAEYAAQAAGGAATGLFVDAHSTELQYLIDRCDARFIFVKSQEQVDNIKEIRNQLPKLEKVFYWVSTGLQHYRDPFLMSFEGLEGLGQRYEKEHPELFEQRIQNGKGEDIAIICYTSGTTSAFPKAVTITHNQLIKDCTLLQRYDPWHETDMFVSRAAPVSAMEQMLGVAVALVSAAEINFPEGPDTVDADMREIAPQCLCCSTRFWEDRFAIIQASIVNPIKKALFDSFLRIGYRVADTKLRGKAPNFLWRSVSLLGSVLVFRPLRDKLGLLKIRSAYQWGSILSPECLRFFHAIGVNLKQVYAVGECGLLAMHRDSDVKAGSVGMPVEDDAIRLNEIGEILCRCEYTSLGYHKNPETTNKCVNEDGWLHTGDIGFIDSGHLTLLGRSEEVSRLSSGELVGPESIESRLRFSPYIRHAIVIGGEERGFVSALICMRYENVGNWAKSQQITYASFADLSQKPEVYDLIRGEIKKVNKSIPVPARIVKFANLHKELDADEGELTRNGKLRRSFVREHYKDVIDAIYEGKEEYVAEAEVRYRDGRTRKITTGVQITSV